MSNHIHGFMRDAINHPCLNFNGVYVREWIDDYISLAYNNILTYPRPNPDAGLADLC